jgi:hypothetical protein
VAGRILTEEEEEEPKALELLLPRVGARRLLQASSGGNAIPQNAVVTTDIARLNESRLLDDLLVGIGQIGHNTGPIAEMWAKLLLGFLSEEEQNGVGSGGGSHLPRHWIEAWVPSLARSLISETDPKRRKQVASFCLPRISLLVGGGILRLWPKPSLP